MAGVKYKASCVGSYTGWADGAPGDCGWSNGQYWLYHPLLYPELCSAAPCPSEDGPSGTGQDPALQAWWSG